MPSGDVWVGGRGCRARVCPGGGEEVVEIELLSGAPSAGDSPPGTPPPLARALEQLGQYLRRERTEFTFPIRLAGPAFHLEVWRELRRVRHGEVTTYGALAARLGRPSAARAVGAAMAKNRLPLAVPCHRVVAADGCLTGFAYGLEWKRFLLDLERA